MMPDESGNSQPPSALQQLLGSYRHSGARNNTNIDKGKKKNSATGGQETQAAH